ncbi:MAG: isopentenyl-diphosphate Delta-isomerase [Brevibacterium yomogidense]|uniref:isopentenyl-diphosphate Delta-isomerase n=1 Tax=Brevibacterium sp. Mu109 TaxID=1255669 RepID=UPI000C466E62|nr:isopentenyl-diphosphate Delta-isomerase [Brevibacterium sp. Mu109]SMX90751.1 isopentenyl-diphosphate delta-isomerase [Brevibacterium sp. Mu109]
MPEPERVVLLDDHGRPAGTALKSEVHGQDTPLHLAFSCYLFDEAGAVLVTRRALTKRTWPGVWTNSFCGHPGPGEELPEAVHRRAREELGATVRDVSCEIPGFRYRAIDASGIIENEICPVHTAVIDGDLEPDPSEVSEWAWVRPEDLRAAVEAAPFAFSPWLVEQLPQLTPGTGPPR